MACPALLTGSQFLGTTLAHLDCQGQMIGAYGYGALSDPGSIVAGAMTALLTIFIALFGIRLLLGHPVHGRDVVGDVIRVGFVLTLALSWPAWRVIGYNVVINGPGEIATIVGGASGLPAGEKSMQARLQNADDGIVAMTTFGTGRLTGGVVGNSDRGDSFHGIALADDTGFGWGRVLFLTSVLGPYAVVHVGGGILLAITPLMAGLLLFGQTMGLFVGWIRGLVFAALGSVTLTLAQGVELALLSPWVNDVIHNRDASTFTPSAPTELIVLALAFCALNFGLLVLMARVVFMPHAHVIRSLATADAPKVMGTSQTFSPVLGQMSSHAPFESHSRAATIAEAVAGSMRREEAGGFPASAQRFDRQISSGRQTPSPSTASVERNAEMLGSSFRRTQRRTSASGKKRDRQS